MPRRLTELATLLVALALAPALGAEEPKAKPADDRPRVTLTWSTASEVDNFGYFVMRGEEEKGPFKAVNEKAIPGAGNSEVPRDYKYEDFAVTPGKTYWYYLESVSTSGVREKFSPVLKRQCCKQVEAKKPAEAAKPAEAPKPAGAEKAEAKKPS